MRIAIRAAVMCLLFVSTPVAAEKVSWYGIGDGSGSHTAEGKRFNPHALGAAHRKWKFGTKVRVTYKGKSLCIPITDRGPFKKGRELDVTYEVARQLGMLKAGVVDLQVKKGC